MKRDILTLYPETEKDKEAFRVFAELHGGEK